MRRLRRRHVQLQDEKLIYRPHLRQQNWYPSPVRQRLVRKPEPEPEPQGLRHLDFHTGSTNYGTPKITLGSYRTGNRPFL